MKTRLRGKLINATYEPTFEDKLNEFLEKEGESIKSIKFSTSSAQATTNDSGWTEWSALIIYEID